ncbi:MAG TPA: LysR family transcriptional regulator [Nocardioidaceae bacterium]|nr:LysR family transcriptional regulator [Nocardioidaceae bacterium]
MAQVFSVTNVVQLRTLVAVVRHGSFSGAAKDLGYSPSAVSQQIAALERTCKVELFERRAHSVHPTPVARQIAERSNEVLMALDRLRDQIRAISQGWAGSIRVGAFGTASQHLLPAAVSSFVKDFPGSEVMLEEGLPTEMLRALAARDLDVALVYSHGPSQRKWSQELTFVELLKERMVLVLPDDHPFASSGPVSMADLRDEKWITSHEGTPGAELLEELGAAAGMAPNIGFRTNDPDVIERLVRERVGVALLPALGFVPMDGIVGATLADPNAMRIVYAAFSADGATPLVEAFVGSLRDIAVSLEELLP